MFASAFCSLYYDISTHILIHLLSYYSVAVDEIGVDTVNNVQYPATQQTKRYTSFMHIGIICEMSSKICYFFIIFVPSNIT